MHLDFSGKVAVVTGGARGIGGAVVRKLAAGGCAVVIADIVPEGEGLAAALQDEGYRVRFVRSDVTRAADVRAMIAVAEHEFGGLDILVNSAGIFPRATLQETTEELWDRIHNINLKGVYLACQAAEPTMARRGGGSIVNIGSLNARTGHPNLMAYAASKGGVLTLTRNLARALAPERIRVNCVHPGWVISEGEIELHRKEGRPDGWLESQGTRMPLGRLQTPDDIAHTVVFLASDLCNQVTGQDLAVDGGLGL